MSREPANPCWVTTEPPYAAARFAHWACCPDGELDLDEAALLIAAPACPHLNIALYRRQLDAIAAMVRCRWRHDDTPVDRLAAMMHYLHTVLAWRGNNTSLGQPSNFFLNAVLEHREGHPLALAIAYLAVATRLNLPLAGVDLPGYLLLRHDSAATVFIDPYRPEDFLSPQQCQSLFAESGAAHQAAAPSNLGPTTKRQVLIRWLEKLQKVYRHTEQPEQVLRLSEYILLFAPEAIQQYRERAIAMLQLSALQPALEAVELFLPHAQETQERLLLTRVRDQLRQRLGVIPRRTPAAGDEKHS